MKVAADASWTAGRLLIHKGTLKVITKLSFAKMVDVGEL